MIAAMDTPAPAPLGGWQEVELASAGYWELSTGPVEFTPQNWLDAIAASQCPAIGNPVIKLGHIDPRFDGEPSIGRVTGLHTAKAGNKIVGDLDGMPGWLAAIAPSAYPQRSIEAYYDVKCSIGHTHPFVMTAVALLGVATPGVGNLTTLGDVAALYGVEPAVAAGAHVTAMFGGPVGKLMAAGVTTDDVRRAYFATNPPYSWWITEIQLDPMQLIACDDSSAKVYRIPITISGADVSFGDAVEVQIEYMDVKASALTGRLAASMARAQGGPRTVLESWPDLAASRTGIAAAWDGAAQVKNLGTDPTAAQLKKLFALPADSKSDSKLPHHAVAADGTVGAADVAGCQAAIAAINGSMGGLKGVSEADARKAYGHCAAHVKAAGKEPAEYKGPGASAAAGDGPGQGPYDGSHSHPAAATMGADMEFSAEQLALVRTRLGLAADAEVTVEQVMAALATPAPAPAPTPAGGQPAGGPADNGQGTGPGVLDGSQLAAAAQAAGAILIDAGTWESMQQGVQQGVQANARMLRSERDTAMATAVREGRIPASRTQHWAALWDKDPEGTKAVLATVAKNSVPVADIGTPGTVSPDEAEEFADFDAIYPPHMRVGAGG